MLSSGADPSQPSTSDGSLRAFSTAGPPTSCWTGETSPFSDYATHVLVGEGDVPVTVAQAVVRSMKPGRVRGNGDDRGEGTHHEDEDGTDDEDRTATSLSNTTAGPLTPQQLLYLGSVWHLPSHQYSSNHLRHLEKDQETTATTRRTKQKDPNNPPAPPHHHSNDAIHKPVRLTLADSAMPLQVGDYLRIHHTPRRFSQVYRYSWETGDEEGGHNNSSSSSTATSTTPPSAAARTCIVREGGGYCIINKPPLIPVHGTVDNAIENVIHQLGLRRKRRRRTTTTTRGQPTPPPPPTLGATDGGGSHEGEKEEVEEGDGRLRLPRGEREDTNRRKDRGDEKEDHRRRDRNSNNKNNPANKEETGEDAAPYVAAVQRLDVNTSGLLVVATEPEFASYFAKLLRQKTANQTTTSASSSAAASVPPKVGNNNNNTNHQHHPTIYKGYRCLVCIQPRDHVIDDDYSSDSEPSNNDQPNRTVTSESALMAWQRLASLLTPQETGGGTSSAGRPTPTVIRHYTKVSERAPKVFVTTIPTATMETEEEVDTTTNNRKNNTTTTMDTPDQWQECLLYITRVSPPIPLLPVWNGERGDEDIATGEATATAGPKRPPLASALWPVAGSMVPPNVRAVAEVEVSLITGRTHQIRGQLSQLGFPIVGDEQYGGAVPLPVGTDPEDGEDRKQRQQQQQLWQGLPQQGKPPQQQLLALQCCQLSFLDADYETAWNPKKRARIARGRPNQEGRRVEARLDEAWWTPILREHSSNGEAMIDLDLGGDADAVVENEQHRSGQFAASGTTTERRDQTILRRPDLLPPRVQLSPGRNKYVLARLRDPETSRTVWFVKSAAPDECGGGYHANVAQDLVEWIHAVPGYETVEVDITGGGRIDYVPSASPSQCASTAHVYGFSYRYGKGDHARAAALIEAQYGQRGWNNIRVSYDESDSLY
jgi:23S rRNA-/tRNA-specific pseudouridylate synthase